MSANDGNHALNKLIAEVSGMTAEIKHLAISFSDVKDTFKESQKESKEELEKLKVKLDKYIDKVNDLEVNQGKVESLLSEVSKNQDRNKNLVMTIIGAILVAAIMGGLAFRMGGA